MWIHKPRKRITLMSTALIKAVHRKSSLAAVVKHCGHFSLDRPHPSTETLGGRVNLSLNSPRARGLPWWSSGKTSPSSTGVLVRSLVREIRFHTPCNPKTKTSNRSNIVTNLTKNFKDGPH